MAYKFQEGLAKLDGQISGSSTIIAKTSFSASADLAVTGNVHAAQFYGGGAGITGISSDAVDVTGTAGDRNYPLVFTEAAQAAGTLGLGLDTSLVFNPSSNLFTAPGRIITDSTTDATSKTNGSLQTDGGLSVAKAIYNGTAATFAADSGVVTMGAATALTVSAAGIVNVNNATDAASKTDGSLQTDGGLSVAKKAYVGTGLTVEAGGVEVTAGAVNIDDTTAASSKTTGALKVAGGISSQLKMHAGTGITTDSGGVTVTAGGVTVTAGRVTLDDATEATSTTNGSLQTDGGLSVAKSVVIGDDLDLLSDSCIINIGSTSKFTLTDQAANNCVMAAISARLAFGNAGEYISGDGTDLKIVSSGDIDMTGDLDVVGTMSCDTSITLDSTTITTAEIGVLDGVSVGVGAASKALVLSAGADISSGLRSLTGSGDVKFANGHYTGGIFTAGSDTIGSDGQDEVTINSVAAFQNGWELNITASGGPMDLTNAGAMIVLCTGSAAQTVTLQGSSVPNDGYAIAIKNASSSDREVTITGSATGNVYDAYTIDGETSLVLESPYAAVNLIWSAVNGGWSVY